jgi:hypothetical protein
MKKPGHGWKDNIKVGRRGMGWEVVDWIHVVRDRDQWRVFVNPVMNLQVP